jgi:hypothetical protein
LGFIYSGGIQGLACRMVVHSYEETTKYEELLNEKGLIFHCSTISKIISRDHFMALTKYFHVINPAT